MLSGYQPVAVRKVVRSHHFKFQMVEATNPVTSPGLFGGVEAGRGFYFAFQLAWERLKGIFFYSVTAMPCPVLCAVDLDCLAPALVVDQLVMGWGELLLINGLWDLMGYE
jgi:hypothetical protein